MALGHGAWTPYPWTRAVPVLCPCCARAVPRLRQSDVPTRRPKRTVQHRAFGTGPSPPHRQISLFKDVCSKTLAIVAGRSHFWRMSLAKRPL